ncbi:MAG: carbon-nitrogen hydrolase family protein, partial [Bacteroidales bacterium]|nr:carbon-nitrogen hydrolase family protein [Bacteroidales bacterium]
VSMAAVAGDEEKREMQQITIAAISSRNEIGQVDTNLAHYSELIAKTKELHPDVDLILFPEMGLVGFESTERMTEFAEPIPGPASDKACALARKHNVALALGMAEVDDGKFYITHFVVTPDGYVGKYRKIYSVLSNMGRYFTGGTEFPVFELKGFRFGFNICYDNRFPLNAQMVVHNGADIMFTPFANGTSTGKLSARQWVDDRIGPRGVAWHHKLYVIGCNHSGSVPKLDGSGTVDKPGGAFVISPSGKYLDRSTTDTNDEDIICVSIAMEKVEAHRQNRAKHKPVVNMELYQPLFDDPGP